MEKIIPTEGTHMKPYRGVCFDFDYTLGDSTASIIAAYQYALTQLGWPEPDPDAIRRTIGYLVEDSYTMLTGDTDPERRAKARPLFLSVAKPRQKEETVLFDGAVELIRGLHDRGVQVSIVSTKSRDTIEYIMHRYGLTDALTTVVGTEDVTRHKPDPEGLNLALKRMGLTADQVLFCGDTTIDAGTAKNAGCDFAAVLLGVTPEADFKDWPCKFLAKDLWALDRWLQD